MSAPVPSRDSFPRWWRGPPLAFQILGLLIGGLVVAQLVTLFLTMVLPPSPPSQYGLDDIAARLRGEAEPGDHGGLQRIVQAGPPDLTGPGWLISERSRHELAAMLRVDDADVSLSFFTPLPFAGSAMPPPHPRLAEREVRGPMADDGMVPALSGAGFVRSGFADGDVRLILAQAQGGRPGGMPPGLPPGQGGAIGNGPPPRDVLPPGVRPGSTPPAGVVARQPGAGRGGDLLPPRAGSLYSVDATPLAARGVYIPGDGGAAVPPLLQTPATAAATTATAVTPRATLPADGVAGALGEATLPRGPFGESALRRQSMPGSPIDQPGFRVMTPPVSMPEPSPIRQDAPAIQLPAPVPVPAPRPVPAAVEAPFVALAPPVPALVAPVPLPAPATVPFAPPPTGMPIAVTPPSRGLFGFAPAPFVEGDFVAALRLPDGRWSVVQPAVEPFPNAWQRRLLLWFAVAFAIVAPLGWLFARRLVKPLTGFATAAERLGRDPAGAVIALDGPAEMGRAARAFNLMQNRLRSFVDDRTAMVGAISHDLRTPLTRLRFRIEDVPDDQREGMLEEVAEMEAMISSVLDFIRDASTPNARERMDLRTLVDDVVEDAVMIGNDVTVEQGGSATVEVDVLGMRRVLDNLLENAVKYGARARVRLRTEPDLAVAEIFDDGPGLPEDELERVFEPFYRSEAALNSGARGSGLGLAVCRSITRAHGGDVRLVRSSEGFVAQVRVPLAA